MTTIYIFSGLGTDERVFQYIDFSGFSIHYVQWITPQKREPISTYAKRMAAQIHHPKPVLIGVSFGGIMAAEVAKLITVEKIILIASAKTRYEIPFYYLLAGALNLHTLLPANLLMQPNRFAGWLFGIKEEQSKNLLAAILRDTNKHFLKWAINAIVHWNNEYQHPNIIHLHGTADRILPYRFIKSAVPVHEGGHFMIVNKAVLLTATLSNLLAALHTEL